MCVLLLFLASWHNLILYHFVSSSLLGQQSTVLRSCDSGAAAGHTIHADETCTFVGMKRGFLAPGAEQFTGRVHVLDIGAPRKLVDEVVAGKRD